MEWEGASSGGEARGRANDVDRITHAGFNSPGRLSGRASPVSVPSLEDPPMFCGWKTARSLSRKVIPIINSIFDKTMKNPKYSARIRFAA
jgi:hypothetical protein